MANAQYSDTASHRQPAFTKIINGQSVQFSDVCVHKFYISDSEDPVIYAAEPIWAWQQTEAGQWVIEHAVQQPYWINQVDYNTYGYQFRIIARLSEQDQTFFELKWGTQ